MSVRCKLPDPGAGFLLALLTLLTLLAACAAHRPGAEAAQAPPRPPEPAAPHLGQPYDIAGAESLLTILVYRGGTLGSAGHNHVIASHALSGTLYVPQDPRRASFEVHVPVATLTVDEEALRAHLASADFPPQVADSAKEGTRHNMLGPALLDAENHPEIVLRALEAGAPEADGAPPDPTRGEVPVRIAAEVRGQPHLLQVTVRYERAAAEVIAAGELPLRQSELGLTPFSAMLGALQVQDEMRVRFRIVARAATAPAAAAAPR